jgi:hypothetical protein
MELAALSNLELQRLETIQTILDKRMSVFLPKLSNAVFMPAHFNKCLHSSGYWSIFRACLIAIRNTTLHQRSVAKEIWLPEPGWFVAKLADLRVIFYKRALERVTHDF